MAKQEFNRSVISMLAGICTLCMLCTTAPAAEAPPKITGENLHSIITHGTDVIVLVGNHGTIYRSNDAGASFVKQKTGLTERLLTDGDFVDPQTGWVVGNFGTVLKTTDGGANWAMQDIGSKTHLMGVDFIDARTGWVVGEMGTILCTTDGGATWVAQGTDADGMKTWMSEDALGPEPTLNSACFIGGTGWIVGEMGTVLKTTDRGATWQAVVPADFKRESIEELFDNPLPNVFDITFVSAKTGYMCGMNGTVLTTTDGGNTWRKVQTPTEEGLYAISATDASVWAVGGQGAWVASTDGGTTWRYDPDAITFKWWFGDVAFTTPQNGWIVGQAGLVVQTTDGGNTWQFRSGLNYAFDWFEMPKALEFKGMVVE